MKLYYTGSEKGNLPQTSPLTSLGGYVSSTPLPNGSLNNLFGAISQYGKEKMIRQVRAIVLKNETGATATPNIWYDMISSEPITNYRFAFVTLAQNDCGWYMESIAQGDALPINATFIDPRTEVNKVAMPAMANNSYLGIWIERTYNPTAVESSSSCENLISKFETTNAYQVSTIKFPADSSNSLDGKYFLLNTKNDKLAIWFSTGAGATQPTVTGRELIKVTIATNETAANVTLKVLNQLNLLLTPRGEMSFTSSGPVITATATQYGSFPIPVNVNAGVIVTAVTSGTFNGLETIEDMQMSISY